MKETPGTCFARGDPHFQTFDVKYFDFMGLCKYLLAGYESEGNDDSTRVGQLFILLLNSFCF